METNAVASHLKLSADRNAIFADNQDLSYVTVELRDDYDRLDIDAENLMTSSEGPAVIVGGNANRVSLESYTQPRRKSMEREVLGNSEIDRADAGEITRRQRLPAWKQPKSPLKVVAIRLRKYKPIVS